MSMLDLTKAELDKFQALTPKLNDHLQRVVDAIPYNVNPRMKATIAVAQLTAFASQFRRNIMLWDDTSVPINAISFVITGSGYGKDSSVKAAKKCFAPGYDMINDARKRLVTTAAIKAAAAAGESLQKSTTSTRLTSSQYLPSTLCQLQVLVSSSISTI